jgi:hypothetical protein
VRAGNATVDNRSTTRAAYLLATPALRDLARRDARLSTRLAASVPVAVFGTGSSRVELRQAAPSGARALTRERRAERADRVQAGRELLQNRRVVVDGVVRRTLAEGGLDLRAETLLALFATRATVRVVAVEPDPRTAATGLPARSLVVALPRAAALSMIATMPTDYAPTVVVQGRDGQTHLTWPLTPRAVRPVG